MKFKEYLKEKKKKKKESKLNTINLVKKTNLGEKKE